MQKMIEFLVAQPALTLPQINKWMYSLAWDQSWLEACQPEPFPVGTYGRTVLAADAHFELAVITWPAGEASEIHDHGIAGTFGSVLVLQGQVFNHLYTIRDGEPEKGDAHTLAQGQILEIPKGLIHQMGNASEVEVAMSLHLYTPPIQEHQCWTPLETPVADSSVVG